MEVWTTEKLRSLPPEAMPWSTTVTFVGGMMHGKTKQIPMLSNVDGPLPFNGCERGRTVRHVYVLTGWRPDPGVWVYTLSDGSD